MIRSIVLSAALTAVTIFSAAADFDNFLPQVERELTVIGVEKSTINKISILPRRRTGEAADIIIGYDATVSFHTCGGYLAISLNSIGDVKQVYTRGECSFPGIRSY